MLPVAVRIGSSPVAVVAVLDTNTPRYLRANALGGDQASPNRKEWIAVLPERRA